MSTSGVLGFPNPVNENAARAVAGGVALLCILVLLTRWDWLLIFIAVGFAARVLTGPTMSILGQLATRVIAPRLGPPVWVPGPPKRFAQAIGLALTGLAAIISLGLGATMAAAVLVAIVLVFALLESVIGFCAGCWLFGHLMRFGIIPQSTCVACQEVQERYNLQPREVGPLSTPTTAWKADSTSQAE